MDAGRAGGVTLVVAEKPSVARDIAAALGAKQPGDGYIEGAGWRVSWALGHLVELCEPGEVDERWKRWSANTLPMLPERIPTRVCARTKSQFAVLKRLMNAPDVERIVCATDSGREGELIFRYIYLKAGCQKSVMRLWVSSMTRQAILEGFSALRPDSEYDPLYESARLRSEADWLVGMNASRAFSLRYDAHLSVGRVQTPTLALLVSRDRAIAAFVPEDYWELRANFGDYEGLWFSPECKDGRIKDSARASALKAKVKGAEAEIAECSYVEKATPPPLLYDLTSLQRDANSRLGLSAARTLDAAQSLYEKHKMITYPRTDSRHLPPDQRANVAKALKSLPPQYAKFVEALAGKPLYSGPRVYDASKVSDHHALIPTGARPKGALTDAEARVFDLVARRFIAAFYPDYRYESASIITRAAGETFKSSGATPIELGWRELYAGAEDEESGDARSRLPRVLVGDKRSVTEAHVKKKRTKPPERHTDASLLGEMESAGRKLEDETLRESMKDSGLGTPATRAAIIERLIDVGYAEREGKKLKSTEKGDKLVAVAPPELTSPETTGKWERALSRIAKCATADEAAQRGAKFDGSIRRFSQYIVEAARSAPSGVTFPSEAGRGNKDRRVKR